MPTATYEKIEAITASGSSSSITFSTIPATYTDLVMVAAVSTASSTGNPRLRFNGDTGSNYSVTTLYGSGSAAGSTRGSSETSVLLIATTFMNTTHDMNLIIQVQNYSNTTTNKTLLARANKASAGVDQSVGLWRNTAAITSMTIFSASGANFSTASTFTLYGIKAA